MAEAGTAYIKFEGDFSALRRDLAKVMAEITALSESEEVKFKGDTSNLVRSLALARVEISRFQNQVDQGRKSMNQLTNEVRGTERQTQSLRQQIAGTNRNFAFLRNTIRLFRWPVLIAGLGGAAQGLSAAAAGATALASALAPLTGLLAAYPALLGALGQAAGVTALAGINDLTQALQGNEEALKRLTPAGKEFMKTLQGFEPQFKSLQRAAQVPLFKGLNDGIEAAVKNFPRLRQMVRGTSEVMGDLAARAGDFVGRKGFGRDFNRITDTNTRLLRRLSQAGFGFASALQDILVVSRPLINFLGRTAKEFGKFIREQAQAGRESGRMAHFFRQTKDVLQTLINIGGDLTKVFLAIGHAAAPLGRDILRWFEKGAQELGKWADSLEGRRSLRRYFEEARPAVFEILRLLRDVTALFIDLGSQPGVDTLIRKIRIDLLPVLEHMVKTVTEAFGPKMIDFLVEFGKLFAALAGRAGPLAIVVELMTLFLEGVNALFETIPGFKTLTVAFITLAGVIKAIQFTAVISGFNAIKNSAVGAAVANTALATSFKTQWARSGTIMAPLLAKSLKFAIPGAFAAFGIGETIAKAIQGDTKGAAFQAAGTAIGAALGAAIGSAIPGIGTIVGGLTGAGIGSVLGDLVSGVVGDGKKLTNLQDRLKDTSKALKAAFDAQKASSRGLDRSSERVKKAHDREHDAAKKVTNVEKRLAEARREAGPESRRVMKLEGKLAEARQDQVKATRAARKAERLHGFELEAARQNYKGLLGRQKQSINALKDEERSARRALKRANEANSGRTRSAETQETAAEASKRWEKATKQLDNAQQKQKNTLADISREIGPKFAKRWEDISGRLLLNSRATLRAEQRTKRLNDRLREAGPLSGRVAPAYGLITNKAEDMGKEHDKTAKKVKKGSEDMEDSEKSLTTAMFRGHSNIAFNTNKLAKSFDVKIPDYGLKKPEGGGGGRQEGGSVKMPELALGGSIVPGHMPGDRHTLSIGGRPIARVESKEGVYVVNKTAQRFLDYWNKKIPRKAEGGALSKMIATANRIDARHFPYVWGGGHGGFDGPYDCSGAVSAVLHSAGLLDSPMVSGALANWGQQGRGPLTVFANAGHTFMSLGGKYFGTSGSNPGGGAGWFPTPSAGYLSGFASRTMDVGKGTFAAVKQIPRVILEGPETFYRTVGQGSLDKTRDWANKWLAAHAPSGSFGGGQFSGDWKGVNSVGKFIDYWNMVNPKWKEYASRFGRIVQAESTFNPRAINHIGLGHAGWYQYDPPTWRAYDRGAGDPSWPGGPFQPDLATQHTGTMLDHEGASTFGRWAATDPGAKFGGLLRGFQDGGLVGLAKGGGWHPMRRWSLHHKYRWPKFKNIWRQMAPKSAKSWAKGMDEEGGFYWYQLLKKGKQSPFEIGEQHVQSGGPIRGFRLGGQVPIPGYDAKHPGAWKFPPHLKKIRKGAKGAVGKIGKLISKLINDDSEFGLHPKQEKPLITSRHNADLYGELAGIANTLTTEVPIPETFLPAPGAPFGYEEGTLTVLGKAKQHNEGYWLTFQLAQLRKLQGALILADVYMAAMIEKIGKYVKYLNKQLRIRKKTLHTLKKKLKPLKSAYAKAKGGHKKILKRRLDWYQENITGEQRLINYIKGEKGLDLLKSEETAAIDSKSNIRSSLEDVQGLSGIGGEIFDVQQQLREFGSVVRNLLDREPKGEESGQGPMNIEELIRFAEAIRLGASLPTFAGGGTVPGPRGTAVPIIAHGTEEVLSEQDAALFRAGGGTRVVFADLYIGGEKINEKVRLEMRNMERASDLKRRAGVGPGI